MVRSLPSVVFIMNDRSPCSTVTVPMYVCTWPAWAKAETARRRKSSAAAEVFIVLPETRPLHHLFPRNSQLATRNSQLATRNWQPLSLPAGAEVVERRPQCLAQGLIELSTHPRE